MSGSKADIMRRAHHLAIEIYPKILCITRDTNGTKHITIDTFDEVQPFFETSQYRIILSSALLRWMTMDGRILLSLTDFITTQELSGPLGFYVSPDIYHTQITENSLLSFYM